MRDGADRGGRTGAAQRPSATLAVVALLVAAWALACGSEDASPRSVRCPDLRWDGVPRRASVVLIVNDTMRRDRVGIYGGRAATPVFDAFAADHLWFDRAFTQAPWTKPAIATLFTSLYPSQHRVRSHTASGPIDAGPGAGDAATAALETNTLSGGLTTLAEVLRQGGWRTGAVVANPWLVAEMGFEQGFETYDDSISSWDAPGTELADRGLAWIRAQEPDAPFFLYLHLMDSHQPYPELGYDELHRNAEHLAGDERMLKEFARRHLMAQVRLEGGVPLDPDADYLSLALLELVYDQGVQRFDQALGRFLDGFDRLPAAADSIVIVTSDHGEALFARNWGNHGQGLFDDEVAIPMAMRLPGVTAERSRVDCAVGLVDVMPTLCDLLDVECAGPMFGRSLLAPPAEGDGEGDVQIIEGVAKYPDHRALVDDRYKLIFEPEGRPPLRLGSSPPWSLYDRRHDPEERNDLLAEVPRAPEVQQAFETLSEELERGVPAYEAPPSESIAIDPELAERLESLGYLDDE